jgi:hypothetical protein
MRGSDYRVTNCNFHLDLPPDYKFNNDTADKSSEISNGGEGETVIWKVVAPDKGNNRLDMLYVNFTGIVSGRVGVLSYSDIIGGGTQLNMTVSGLVNHAPTISNATADPSVIPNDGKTPTVISARVVDVDGNLQSVIIDLSRMGRAKNQKMFDDGTHGDLFPNDDIYTIQETAPSSAVTGNKKMELTATDDMTRYTVIEVALTVEEATGPSPDPGKPPQMSDFLASPDSAPNDGTALVLFSVYATDPDGDLNIVAIDMTPLGGQANTEMHDDGTYGDKNPGDGIYSFETFIDSSVSEGKKTIVANAKDRKGNNVSISTEFTVTKQNLKPELSNPKGQPQDVPNDSETQVLLTVRATDPNNNLRSVVVSLQPIGGVSNQKMFDDGSNGDQGRGDNIYSFRTTVPDMVTTGQKDLKVTATDTEGLTDTEHIFINVIDSNEPPVLTGASADLDEVKNNNKTLVTITVTATDPDGNLDRVTIDLSSLGGKSGAKMYDDGQNQGDSNSGDNVFTVQTKVSLNTPPGTKNLTITARDQKGKTATIKVSIDVKQRKEESDPTPGFGATTFLASIILVSVVLLLVNYPPRRKQRKR